MVTINYPYMVFTASGFTTLRNKVLSFVVFFFPFKNIIIITLHYVCAAANPSLFSGHGICCICIIYTFFTMDLSLQLTFY